VYYVSKSMRDFGSKGCRTGSTSNFFHSVFPAPMQQAVLGKESLY
jgi:hypothetical protein